MKVYAITKNHDKYIDATYSRTESFNLGVYGSIDLARAAVDEDIRFTFNIDRDMDLKALDNFKIWKHTQPNEETIFVSRSNYWGCKEYKISYTITTKDIENTVDDEDPIGSDITEETIEKVIPEEDDKDEEKKYVYVYCTKNYNLQLNLDTINELIDEIITAIELDSKTMETTILDIYEYRDSAYKAMCLDYHAMIICSDNHISGSKSKDYMYDIKYIYDMNTSDLTVYIVYKKEVI